jgi:hypothetical protein
MGRVINTDSPGKRRNQLMRTAAELLRHLSQKPDIDADAKNMLALLVFTLRSIADGIDESTVAWENRNYWIKSEEFRSNWRWTQELAIQLEKTLVKGDWQTLPQVMAQLLPHFSDIKVTKFTRGATLWEGCYNQLLDEHM